MEGYEKWRDKELGITGHTSEGGWEVDVCIRGESFPYAVECYEQAKSDLSNLCIAVDTKIEKAIDDISARLPKNPNLRIHLLGEHGFEDLAQSMSNNEDVIRSVKTEGSNLLVEVLAAYQAIDGDKPLEVFESPDGPLDYGFELFGQKFYYDNEASAMHESEIATKFFVETVRSMVLEKDKQ